MRAAILTATQVAAERLKALVLGLLSSAESSRATDDYLGWCQFRGPDSFTKATANTCRTEMEARRLSPSTISLSAVCKLALGAADNSPVSRKVAAGIARVKGAKRQGVRTGTWRARQETKELLSFPAPAAVTGCRDHALVAVLAPCGLLSEEAAGLVAEHVQIREARCVIVDLVGKGERVGSLLTPRWTMLAIDARPLVACFLGVEPFDRARMHRRMRQWCHAAVAGATVVAESRLRGGR